MTSVMRGARIDLLFTMSDNTRTKARPLGAMPKARESGSHERANFCWRRNLWRLRRSRHDAKRLVEPDGIEPTTSCLQSRRSPN